MNSYMTMDISKLQAHVIIQCLAYYDIGETLMSDGGYKVLNESLYARQRDEYVSPAELIMSTRLGYATWNHDYSTGFDLMAALTEEDREALRETTEILLEAKFLRESGRLNTGNAKAKKVLDRMKALMDKGLWLI